MFISKSTIKRIFKEAGAQRVSNEAMAVFHINVNKMVFNMATRSVKLAKHAKRKTVAPSDIKLAVQAEA